MECLAALVLLGLVGTQDPPPVESAAPSQATVEYLIEVYESPSSAPPPDVAGPQGRRLFIGTIKGNLGEEVRHFVPVGEATSDPAKMRGISIAFTSRLAEALLETEMIVDTNLPFGPYDQKKDPVWLRARTSFAVQPGARQYVPEAALAQGIEPSMAPPGAGGEPGAGDRAAQAVVEAGVNATIGRTPIAGFLPPAGDVIGQNRSPRPRPTALLFVVTPVVMEQ